MDIAKPRTLRELANAWRENAREIRSDPAGFSGTAEVLDECADDLDLAIATTPMQPLELAPLLGAAGDALAVLLMGDTATPPQRQQAAADLANALGVRTTTPSRGGEATTDCAVKGCEKKSDSGCWLQNCREHCIGSHVTSEHSCVLRPPGTLVSALDEMDAHLKLKEEHAALRKAAAATLKAMRAKRGRCEDCKADTSIFIDGETRLIHTRDCHWHALYRALECSLPTKQQPTQQQQHEELLRAARTTYKAWLDKGPGQLWSAMQDLGVALRARDGDSA